MSDVAPVAPVPREVLELAAPIAHAVAAADAAAVVTAVQPVPAARRGLVGAVLTAHLRHSTLVSWTDRGVREAERLASVALAVHPVQAAQGLEWIVSLPPDEARARAAQYAQVLGGRGRAWLSRFVASLLASRNRNAALTWHLVDGLVAAGAMDPPTHPNHRVDVLSAFPWDRLPAAVLEVPGLAAALREVVRTPGAGLALARAADTRPPRLRGTPAGDATRASRWAGLLTALGAHDPTTRPGLLDDCLAALSGSLPARDAPGFAAVHERLGVTLDELAERHARYTGLLLSPAPSAVVLARTHLRRLLDAGRLDADDLLEVTPDVLLRREKVVVKEHLRLLTDALGAGAVDPAACARAVVAALDPGRTDLALAAGRLLRRCGRLLDEPALPRLAHDVTSAVPDPSPDLRRVLGPLGAPGPASAAPPPSGPPRHGTAAVAGAPAPDDPLGPLPVDLPEAGRVEPVRDLDELRALLEEMHVVPTSPVDVERALAGLVRFRAEPVAARRLLAALARRPRGVPPLDQALYAWAGHDTRPAVCEVEERGHAFERSATPADVEVTEHRRVESTGWRPSPGAPVEMREVVSYHWRRTLPAWLPQHLVQARLSRISTEHLRRAPAPLLATPTYDDGTLAADAFLARLREREATGAPLDPHDVGTALLRLRPGDRAAVRDSGSLDAGTAERLALVDTDLTWRRAAVGVARFRGDEETVGLWQSAQSPVGSPDDPVRGWLDTHQLVRMYEHLPQKMPADWGDVRSSDVSFWALALPSHPDVLAAHLQRVLAGALEDAHTDVSTLVALLGDARVPLGAPAVHALVVGGAARSAHARSAAADALARVCGRGLVTRGVLAEALLAAVRPDGAPHSIDGGPHGQGLDPKVNRVAATLTDAAGIDHGTGRLVLAGLLDGLGVLSQVRGGVAFVELAARLAERFRVAVVLPEPLATLAAGRSSSRTAQEARRLAAAAHRTSPQPA